MLYIIYNYFQGDFNEKGFNFGKSAADSSSLEQQAADLLSAMEADNNIDMNTYWKVRSLLL